MRSVQPGDEGRMYRFHLLLAAEQHHSEAAVMHGLFVLAYYAQHPSLSKVWLRVAARGHARDIRTRSRPARSAGLAIL
jgi:hypothetical protein